MKRKYYLIIVAAVLTAIVIFSMLNYSILLILYVKYFDPHNINVFFITKNGKLIQNVSVSLFAFYPTSRGTVIREIYHGHNLKYLSIPVSNLTWYANQWLGTYNYTIVFANRTHVIKKHIKYNASIIIPSLIGFASYYVINQSNGTMTIYTQPFSIRVSPYNITHGIGKTVIREFVNPIVQQVKLNESNSSTTSNNIVTPQQTITVTTTSPPSTIATTTAGAPCSGYVIKYVLKTYWLYPNNNTGQLGPMPLTLAYVTDYNGNDYWGFLGFAEGSAQTSGLSVSFGITIFYGFNLRIIGTSVTLKSGSYTTSAKAFLGQGVPYSPINYPWSYPYFADVETFAQIAIANYTEELYEFEVIGPYCHLVGPFPEGTVTMFFITGLVLSEENGVYLPALYNLSLYNLTDPQSFFNKGKLVYLMTIPAGLGNGVLNLTLTFSTYYGFVGPSIPIGPLLKYALQALGSSVPDWALLVSPSVVITPFTNYASAFAVAFAMKSESSNTYYVYYENTSVQYNIGGNNYYLPMYYFYINYTS